MKQAKKIYKESGEEAIFSIKKVVQSLVRAGADPHIAQTIAEQVERQTRSYSTTRDIYKRAFQILKQRNQDVVAARYSLKNAIMALGPSGYPFENFVGSLFQERGFFTRLGVTVQGHCVPHEVDVIATKEEKRRIYVECKFHNNKGYSTDVKVPLYIHSRFNDILKKHPKRDKEVVEQWIVTNTRFSQDALTYGRCNGLVLIGWRTPAEGGLETLIEEIGLHPVTCLTNLTKKEKEVFLREDIVLCKQVLGQGNLLNKLGIHKARRHALEQEITQLCV